MATQARSDITPPPRFAVEEYNTPNFQAGYYTELINREDPGYVAPQRGMLYSTIRGANQGIIKAFPNLYFLREQRFGNSQDWVFWIWGSDPLAEDTYNSEVYYAAESVDCPGYIRMYTIRRDEYDANPNLPAGSALGTIISVSVTTGGSGYTSATATSSNGAVMQVIVANGSVQSIVVKQQGAPVTSAPTVTISGTGTGATAEAVIQGQTAILIGQKKQEFPDGHPFQNEYVRVIRTYQVLPGPLLYGQQYNEQYDFTWQYTLREILGGASPIGTARSDISPIDSIRSQLKTLVNPSQLSSLSWQFGTMIYPRLPDTLVSAENFWNESYGIGAGSTSLVTIPDGTGCPYAFSTAASSQSSAAVAGEMSFIIRGPTTGPIPANRVVFFLPLTACDINSILTALGVQAWPTYQPESIIVALAGGSVSTRQSTRNDWEYINSSGGVILIHTSETDSTDYDTSSATKPVQIPQTLHGDIAVSNPTYSGHFGVNGATHPATIPATTPSSFPYGTYLYEVDTRPFMTGWAIISATLVTISSGMVN